MINYEWINGATTHCRCGQVGSWAWTEIDGFVIWHSEDETCQLDAITPRQERMLRIARSRKHPY